jgi:exodeoxyribonuclease-5
MARANPFATRKSADPLTTERQQAIADFLIWYEKRSSPLFSIFGSAGAGKTTLAKDIAALIKGLVCFAAFSGKAASVMRLKGCPDATTIHNLIYLPPITVNGKTIFPINDRSRLRHAALLIIDEISMVDAELAKDLRSFDVPTLVLGDPAQLPPVKGLGFFNRDKPDVMLTSIHRQKLDSPIIEWSKQAREGKRLAIQEAKGSFVRNKIDVDIHSFLNADQILVGRNDTRHRMNLRIRELRGLPPGQPLPGDKLVCLKNSASKNLFNGEIWFVTELLETSNDVIRMKVRPETGQRSDVSVSVPREYFEQLTPKPPDKKLKDLEQFTFAYALTVHKAQGSEWPSVILYDESGHFRGSESKWLYTGITRASESIGIYV